MPLPLLLAVPALAGMAGTGIAKGAQGVRKYREARAVDEDSRERYESAVADADLLRVKLEDTLEGLGRERLGFFDQDMPAFIEFVNRLRNAEIAAQAYQDTLPDDIVDDSVFHDVILRQTEVLGAAAASGVAAYAAANAATLGVTSLAAASTGTAISGLSGVAATNATLAWLGGGTIAAGGGGVAAGTTVLAGIAAAPAVFVGGFVVDKVMDKKLAQAHENAAEVDAAIARLSAAAEVWTQARLLASRATTLLVRLREAMRIRIGRLSRLGDHEADVSSWDPADQDELRAVANLAGLLTALASCPLIAPDGLIDPRFVGVIDRCEGAA